MNRGGCPSTMALVLLGLAALPVGLIEGFQPFEFLLLFQVHFLM